MPTTTPAVQNDVTRRLLRAVRTFVVHPLGHFTLFIFFLYQVKEFYPFTHVPMYSDPEARAPYLYLSDGEGKALGVKTHGGITNPKMRKMYNSRLDRYCRENDLDKNNPPQAAIDVIGSEVIDFLRKQGRDQGRKPLPETVRLMHVLIEPAPAPDAFKETRALLLEQTVPAQP